MSPYPFLEERKMIIGSCKFAHRTKLHSWFYSGYLQVLTTRTSSENKRAEAVGATYMTAFVSLPALPIVFQSLLQKMLAVFEKSIANPPKELSLPVGRNHSNSSPEEIAEIFRSWRSDSTFYNLSSGNFLALSHRDENPAHPRCIIVMDDIFCIFSGALYNTCDLRRHYGLSRQATEAMIIIEAYKDRDGCVQLHWGTAADGSLVCTDDPNVISAACGKCYTPFPPGCIFISGNGLISFDHPLNKVRGIPREDEEGNISAVIFQVDLFTRLHSIPRSGSAANWANATVVEGE
ncbi:Stem-specific protein TSJT1 [Sesamum angolense]|uniref:Stem-specific protein TSJT1 n=1 Tax=Sesamum angolense TaxID=2727404 RepID=A0AAE2BV88_9LAMI|nr:Stem-specific protein TSJT1 [Sesamum angolense]